MRSKKIQDLVEGILSECRISKAPVDVKKVARKLHLDVQSKAFEKDELSGMLIRQGDKNIIGVNSEHHDNRKRFTIAHEIGHFLLHKGERIFIDKDYRVSLRNQDSGTGANREEIEANIFASHLLMPESFLNREPELHSLDLEHDSEKIDSLAKKYKVSSSAMNFRLMNRMQ